MDILDASSTLSQTSIPGLPLWRRGKVRDVYDLGDRLLIVTTDRISAFDVVLPTPIPGEGRGPHPALALLVPTCSATVVPNHVISATVDDYPRELHAVRDQLEGRSMLVKKTEPFPVECVVRGYLVGSGWKDYQRRAPSAASSCRAGLRESDRLEQPIFTPSTKAETGHDENISFEQMSEHRGRGPRGRAARPHPRRSTRRARAHAEKRGIILADTKLEFGTSDGRVVWIDEAFTPDSSRFWPRDGYEPGRAQPSFDKQYVRDYLETLDWDKRPPGPPLPEDVVTRTREKYLEAYARLTGTSLDGARRVEPRARRRRGDRTSPLAAAAWRRLARPPGTIGPPPSAVAAAD